MKKKQSPSADKLFKASSPTCNSPVECHGITFPNDEERRKHFLEKLRAKLKDPEFRKIEGFPVGSDESILALSDPPYYTACPNPFIGDFIKHYGTSGDTGKSYSREPFAADVSEGKNDPIYNAHSYHTKVPHKAIMRYILHYTSPGDVVLDGFCGTGMTGIAAQLCASVKEVSSLGYTVRPNGNVYDSDKLQIAHAGMRHAILTDLSPFATFVSNNYSNLSCLGSFADEATEVIDLAEKELAWLYDAPGGGRVLSAVWSDVFICPNCSKEMIFHDVAIDGDELRDSFPCPHCHAVVGKAASKTSGAAKLERPLHAIYDPVLRKNVRVPKFVLVEETVKKGTARLARTLKEKDRQAFNSRFDGRSWPSAPTDEFFAGRQTNKLINGSAISHVCHMYTPRALFAYAYMWRLTLSTTRHTSLFRFCLSSVNNYISRKQGVFGGGGGVSGTLFTPSLHLERNVFDVLRRKLKKVRELGVEQSRGTCVSTQSIVDLRNVPDRSVDYVFTDPPFGESLQYAELNMFVEAWLGVKTAKDEDCVLNYVHSKDLQFYSRKMHSAFREYARVLKDGRWITVEFHNSQNAVWAAIQQAIEASGLVVADVRILDKQQRSFNAVNRAGAVDQDLVISAYKPTESLGRQFRMSAGTDGGVWDFVQSHLRKLPVFVQKRDEAEIVAERQKHLLFDRMVAFHVQRGASVPISASAFYAGLAQRLSERDGMFFLPEQAAEYDRRRSRVTVIKQLTLFVIDEASAIEWIRQQLTERSQTFKELQPQFMKEIAAWEKHERPLELMDLLRQNFICYDGDGQVPNSIHAYLSSNFKELRNLPKTDASLREKAKDRWYVPDPNKAGDLEKLRERALLVEFEEYRASKQRSLKVFRTEAIRAGFKAAYDRQDYKTIAEVAAKLPESVLQEDEKLLMYYDVATMRLGDEAKDKLFQ